jgi:hypothetical protein
MGRNAASTAQKADEKAGGGGRDRDFVSISNLMCDLRVIFSVFLLDFDPLCARFRANGCQMRRDYGMAGNLPADAPIHALFQYAPFRDNYRQQRRGAENG